MCSPSAGNEIQGACTSCGGKCNGTCGDATGGTRRCLPRSTAEIIKCTVLKWGEIVVDENGCIYVGDGVTAGGNKGGIATATTLTSGTVRFLTDAEFEAGAPYPPGTVMTPEQVCAKIPEDTGGGGGEPPVDADCPPPSDFTISADGKTATYNGTETNVQFCYKDNFGNSGIAGASTGVCFPVAPGDTVSLSHDNFDWLALGSLEVGLNGTDYAGTPPAVPGGTAAPATPVGLNDDFTLKGDCPGLRLETTQANKTGNCISLGAFSYV